MPRWRAPPTAWLRGARPPSPRRSGQDGPATAARGTQPPAAPGRPHRRAASPAARSGSSNVEGLSTTATVLLVGIVELEPLVQALAHEVELGAVEIGEALRIDEHAHAIALEG